MAKQTDSSRKQQRGRRVLLRSNKVRARGNEVRAEFFPSNEVRAEFQEVLGRLEGATFPATDAIRRARRLTDRDFTIRINARS
jgi:hypothetical protein